MGLEEVNDADVLLKGLRFEGFGKVMIHAFGSVD